MLVSSEIIRKLNLIKKCFLILKAFDESKHTRDAKGRFAGSGSSKEFSAAPMSKPKRMSRALREAVPELQHFDVKGPRPARKITLKNGRSYIQAADPNGWLLASTHKSQFGPITMPGDEKATGIALKINTRNKYISFAELNSHIPGAGRRMVEAVLQRYPDFTFGAFDMSRTHEDDPNPDAPRRGPSFWGKMKAKYPKQFSSKE